MTYNIHPIVVHFPVALLTLYTILAIIPVVSMAPRVAWHDVKRALLLFGTLGAYVAFSTGEGAEEIIGENLIVEKHSLFASLVVIAFSIALAREIILLIREKAMEKNKVLPPFVLTLVKAIQSPWVEKFLALFGLVVLLVTGALGGAMVYGTSADPLTAPLLKLLGLS